MKTGKTYWETEQIGEKERQREKKGFGRERDSSSRGRKWRGLILTVGENQHLSIFRDVNQ
jgi:hypothetical protein